MRVICILGVWMSPPRALESVALQSTSESRLLVDRSDHLLVV